MSALAETEPVGAKVRKFPCAACGADVVWDPSAAVLKCPYCGATREKPKSAGEVKEHPIEEGLRAPRDLGWGVARKSVRCTRCGATTTLASGEAAGACAFCGTPAVVEAPAREDLVRPEGVLPFKVPRDAAAQSFRQWLSSLWFRPNDLKSRSSLVKLQGVYVPFWTFDAATHSAWTAEAGYHYQVPVEVVENGRTVTRMETRTRWEPASGTLEKFFDDLPVAASKGLDRGMAERVEPFPTKDLAPYDPSFLSGFLAEEYAVDLKDALGLAEERMREEIRQACAREVPGDEYRNLEVVSQFTGVAYKAALLPLWIAAYQYGGKPYRFLVNGVTGKTSGEAPWSVVKIALAVLAALIVILIAASLKR